MSSSSSAATRRPISPAPATRPAGMRRSTFARTSLLASQSAFRSVKTYPGATVNTEIPSRPHSTASVRSMLASAAFEAEYARLRGAPSLSKNEPIPTIVPFASARYGRAAWASASGAAQLASKTRSKSPGASSAAGVFSGWEPALLTSPAIPPARCANSLTAARPAAKSVTSQVRAISRFGSAPSGSAPLRLRHPTICPRAASSTAIAAPIPRLAPVTRMPPSGAIGLARRPLHEALAQLPRLVGVEVVPEQQVVRHPGEARNTGGAGAERPLDRGERQRTAADQLVGQAVGLLAQAVVGHHAVDKSPLERLLCRDLLVEEPHLLGALAADQVLEVPGSVAGVEAAHDRPDLAEHGRLLRDREVADHVQDVPAANGEAVHRGDDWLLVALDQVVDVQDGQDARIRVRVFEVLLPAANAEEALARAGQHEYPRPRLEPRLLEHRLQLTAHLGVEHVPVVGTVQRDTADGAVLLVEDRVQV